MMEIIDFYDRVGGDYEATLTLLRDDERIRKYVRMFMQDTSMASLKEAWQARDIPAAFRAVHTLKGVVLNRGLGDLARAATALTEEIRGGTIKSEASAQLLYGAVCEQYEKAISIISLL